MPGPQGQDQEADQKTEGSEAKSAAQGVVHFDGQDYPLVELSKSGFLAESYRGTRAKGDNLDAQISVVVEGRSENLGCKAFVVRTDVDKQQIACVFFGLSEIDRLVISRYAELRFPKSGEP
jgi:hypothetical protein